VSAVAFFPLFGLLVVGGTNASSTRGVAFLAADAGSTYDPSPNLIYRWDPASFQKDPSAHGADLGPHPAAADPMTQYYGRYDYDELLGETNVQQQRVFGTELYVYYGRGGYVRELHIATPNLAENLTCAYLDMVSTYTFWRFLIQIPLSDSEMKVQYSINDGLPTDFFVPGHHQTMRVAAYSVSDPFTGVVLGALIHTSATDLAPV
jgi:hypothetical protein